MKLSAIVPLSFAVISLAVSGCGAMKGKEAADKAVKLFHEQLDKGDFNNIYAATHADFKAAATEKDFVAMLEAVHRKLGPIQRSDAAGWNINSHNFKTTVVLTYKTTFAEGEAVETFTYRIEGDKAVLLGYNISSQVLITK
jgi:hypothetical protein